MPDLLLVALLLDGGYLGGQLVDLPLGLPQQQEVLVALLRVLQQPLDMGGNGLVQPILR